MVPDIATKGHSFKGAMAYYLHDKRHDAAAPQPTTAERVAWTENRNLAVDDPRAAMHIMIATAKSADQLKAAAGVSNAGRKSNAHVYAYSLAWHPDEAGELDRAEMVRAADASLKALAADHLQAVIVCHRDQKHPHVHIILNRVDPATGKMHGFSKDREILSAWANEYERGRGQVLTPKREEKRLLQETFAKSAEQAPQPRREPQERPKPPKVDKSPAAMLKELGDAQKARHKQEWADLSAGQQPERDKIYSGYGARIKEAAERHKVETKAIWREYFREARTEQTAFASRERTVTGVLRNAIDAATHQQQTGAAGDRGKLSLVFANVLSSQARKTTFEARQELGRAEMALRLRAVLTKEIDQLKAQRAAELATQRQQFGNARTALIERQNVEAAKVREAWRQIYADRGKDPGHERRSAAAARIEQQQKWKAQRVEKKAAARENAPAAPIYRRDVTPAADQLAKGIERKQRIQASTENPTMKDQFDKARQIEQRPKLAPAIKPALVSHPAPAPAPAGETPRPAPKTVQQVPKAPAPAAPVKPPAPRQDFAENSGGNAVAATPAKKDWGAISTPAGSTPAAPKKDWTKAATPAVKEQDNGPTRSGPRRS